jgi:hypothetical protein
VLIRAFVIALCVMVAAWRARAAAAQAPPPEMTGYVLIDPGPVAAPASCSCISSPFTVPTLGPGWGYGDGPAAPSTNAKPSNAARKQQAERDAEERAHLARLAEDALAGNPNASISLGYDLTIGTAVVRNDKQAAGWFHLAARQGHPDAFIQLGYRYSHGVGVPQNDGTAAYSYGAGAAPRDKNAMLASGCSTRAAAASNGIGPPRSTGGRKPRAAETPSPHDSSAMHTCAPSAWNRITSARSSSTARLPTPAT